MSGQDSVDAYLVGSDRDKGMIADAAATSRRKRIEKRRAEFSRFSRSLRDAEQRQEDDSQLSDFTILTVASLAVLALLQYSRWLPATASSATDSSADCLTAEYTPMVTASEAAAATTSVLASYQAAPNDFEQFVGGSSEVATEADQVSKHASKEAIKGFQSTLGDDPVIDDGSTTQGGGREGQTGVSR